MKSKVMYFTAPWCTPCKQLKPKVQVVCKKYGAEFVEINIDDPSTATVVPPTLTSVPAMQVGATLLVGMQANVTSLKKVLDEL